MEVGELARVGLRWVSVSHQYSVCLYRGITHRHIIQLVLIRAPHGIRKVVVLPNHANMLVRVIGEVLPPKERIPLNQILAPELDIDMLALRRRGQQLLRHGDGLAIKVLAQRDPRELEQRGHDVCVRRGQRLHGALGHAGPADEEGDVDVFFDVAALAGGQAVLADVVAVVGGVDQVCVVEDGGAGGEA